jgi:hypothetical protein
MNKKFADWLLLTAGAAIVGIMIGKLFEKKEIQEQIPSDPVDPSKLVYSDENIEL